MNVQEVANQLVEFCRQGQYEKAHNELYCDHAVSVEPAFAPVPKVEGIEAIRTKGQQWQEMVQEFHSAEVSEPIVAGNHFSVTMKNDVTFKEMGRQQMEEVCVYQVKDGKIVSEQFFYPAPPQQ